MIEPVENLTERLQGQRRLDTAKLRDTLSRLRLTEERQAAIAEYTQKWGQIQVDIESAVYEAEQAQREFTHMLNEEVSAWSDWSDPVYA